MDDAVKVLYQKLLTRNLGVLKSNLAGMTEAQSLIPFTEGGSNFNWLLHHVIIYRDVMLRTLGQDGMWPEDKRRAYGKGSDTITAEQAKPLAELVAILEASQERLEQALSSVSEEQWDTLRPDGRSNGELIEFLIWHETYHMGQGSFYRRLAGLKSAIG
jgi:uncharacterized damage-inducible protein DinB